MVCGVFQRIETEKEMKDCVSCIHEYRSPMSEICRTCGIAMKNYESRTQIPQTNADRIRQMSDEELAQVLKRTAKGGIIGQRSEEAWLDWLKQECAT